MKYAEINRKFTDKVNEYIAKGYIINSTTMTGSQGEVAKVDLTDGKEIIRIMISECWYNDWEYKGYEIFVGKANKGKHYINAYGSFNTIWNNELTEISSEKYYQADYYRNKDWFVTEKEIKENSEKVIKRFVNHYNYPQPLSDKAKDIILKYVRRQPKCSRARKESIRAFKDENNKYYIYYRNYFWMLK